MYPTIVALGAGQYEENEHDGLRALGVNVWKRLGLELWTRRGLRKNDL